jgi:ubiquinone/menaquinone biosynthesis C-methylase UbiE
VAETVLFDRLQWRDPLNGGPLEPIIAARTPAGVPLYGALRLAGTDYGYPIVDCVARLTPELAQRYADWLIPFGLQPPPASERGAMNFQPESTVESFGFQWTFNTAMRTESDLRWRVAERFKVAPAVFAGKLVLDAGTGTGDQSRFISDQGAQVVSVDLSSAIDVAATKLRLRPGWVGVQGDITVLPFSDQQFDLVYCEGVIQHTQDSALTVRELCRVLKEGGMILATHYGKGKRWWGRIRIAWHFALRRRFSRMERYKLLLLTGNLAALSYIPLLGKLLRLTTVSYSEIMPNFKTTWTNTFDGYGNHSYQRVITPEEFWRYFELAGHMERLYQEETVVVARRASNLSAKAAKPHDVFSAGG